MPQNRLNSVNPFGISTTARRTPCAIAFAAVALRGRVAIALHRSGQAPPRTVTPANVMSPTFTRSVRSHRHEHVDARAEADEPHAVALLHVLALSRSVTMRRAIKPAICRTRMRLDPVSRPIDVCSFARLDSSAAALRNLPGLCSTSRTTPLTGYRFTWTLNTFMKIEMRTRARLHERRLVDFGDHHDLAVGRRDDEALAALARALRIAEEVRDPERDERQREREQPERPRAPR